ncbi:hypothetical protein AMTRI_Chr08g202190 [Amborella trichopoda]
METLGSFFGSLRHLSLILFHFCFCLFISSNCFKSTSNPPIPEKRKHFSSATNPKKLVTSSWSFMKKLFSCHSASSSSNGSLSRPRTPPGSSTRLSQASSLSSHATVSLSTPTSRDNTLSLSTPPHKKPCHDSCNDLEPHPLLSLSNRIALIPCSICGEIFNKPQLLELHQAVKHAVSELTDRDTAKNIVKIIFQTSWLKREKLPDIQRILKINNSLKILAKFEEYRETIKATALKSSVHKQARCVADGNEVLRFHCCTFTCSLGLNEASSLCNHHYCSLCGIIRHGFSSKLDGISCYSSSYKAHGSIPADLEREFSFMNVKRAMLVCRVIAGRIAYDEGMSEKEGFDSVAGGCGDSSGFDELLVFNPRALLPCFVIIYSM